MKCQHCGINFEDTEKECPICGAKAGSPGRMSRHNSTGRTFSSNKRSYTEKTSFPVRNAGTRRKYPGRQKRSLATLLVIAVFFVSSLLPAIIGFVQRMFLSIASGPQPEISWSTATEAYSLDDVLNGPIAANLADGTYVSLSPDTGSGYELIISNETGDYRETGDAQCSLVDPDCINDTGFAQVEYTAYELYLEPSRIEYNSLYGSEAASGAFSRRADSEDMLYLILCIDAEGGTVTLYDADGSGLFGGEAYIDLLKMQA